MSRTLRHLYPFLGHSDTDSGSHWPRKARPGNVYRVSVELRRHTENASEKYTRQRFIYLHCWTYAMFYNYLQSTRFCLDLNQNQSARFVSFYLNFSKWLTQTHGNKKCEWCMLFSIHLCVYRIPLKNTELLIRQRPKW